MSLNRRDLLKTGVFAGAAVALPAARFVGAGATASRMAETQAAQAVHPAVQAGAHRRAVPAATPPATTTRWTMQAV